MNHEGSKSLFRYWNRLRGTRAAPRRTEIEPAEIRTLLADTMILERDTRGEAVFRLAGTRLCAVYGRELKGYCFPLIWTVRDQRMVSRLVGSVFDENTALLVGFEGYSLSGRGVPFEMILLPLHGGGSSARCLGAISPLERPYWLGADPVVESCVRDVQPLDPKDEALRARMAGASPSLQPGMSALVEPGGLGEGARRVRHLLVLEGGRES